MKNFCNKIAVITGAGTGMGRELAKQLATEGCHVAICDVMVDNLAETQQACAALAPAGTRISTHRCDVANEASVLALHDAVKVAHGSDHIHLLFNNAGVGGGGSFLKSSRSDWERTFAVCWTGVYHCARAFMPMLIASDEACIVNISSVNGFYAAGSHERPQTAYGTAKFAVKGFSEALQIDLRLHAPHVKVVLVMPGHVGTDIAINSRKLHGKPPPSQMDDAELVLARAEAVRLGPPYATMTDTQLRATVEQRLTDFRDKAPLSATAAATLILEGVREERFRVLVGEDAKWLDRIVRQEPEAVYEPGFLARAAQLAK